MNQISKQGLFPWLTLFTGGVGLALRSLLLSSVDGQGLLPDNHFAGILTFILLALFLGFCFWVVRKEPPVDAKNYRKLFPPSNLSAICSTVAAAGIGISAFMVPGTGVLRILVAISGLLGATALAYAAYFRKEGMRPSCFLHILVAVHLVIRVLTCCQQWGTEPQFQIYFFQLLGSLFLMIAVYYRAELDALTGDYRKYLFFGQAALFCCCLCMAEEAWLFYLSAALWIATDSCVLPRKGNE